MRLGAGRWRDRGATIPLVALALPVLVIATAFSVDLGRQRSLRRDLQARADVVALDLVRLLDGTGVPSTQETEDQLNVSLRANGADTVDALSENSNGLTADGVQVEWGKFTEPADGGSCISGVLSDPTACFVSVKFLGPGTIPNAVRVTFNDELQYFFKPGEPGKAARSAVALAQDTEEAYFQVGSFLASVTPASNSFIGAVLGSVIPGAGVLSYNGLIGADVTLAGLTAGLAAVSPNAALDTDISFQTLLLASINALQAEGGNTAAVSLLQGLVNAAPTIPAFSIADLLNAQLGGGLPAGSATLDVLSLLTGGVFLIDGEHAVSVPGAQVGIPGVGAVDFDLKVIERPQIGGPYEGAVARTGQFELTVTPRINLSVPTTPASNVDLCDVPRSVLNALRGLVTGDLLGLINNLLGGILGPCGLLGSGLPRLLTLNVALDLPIAVRAAGADAVLSSIDCSAEPPTITVTPGPIPLELLSDVDIMVTGTLAGQSLGNLVRIRLGADVASVGVASGETFSYPTQFGPPPRRVGSNPLGLAGLLAISSTDVTVLNLPLGPLISSLVTPITNLLNNVLGEIDSLLLPPIASALGLNLGGADLTALSMECEPGNPKLVG